MANVDVLNLNGEKVGVLELSDALYGPDQVNEALLWEAVKHYRASLRQGTHKTKSRTEVSGSGKKLWKQKGTGRARLRQRLREDAREPRIIKTQRGEGYVLSAAVTEAPAGEGT